MESNLLQNAKHHGPPPSDLSFVTEPAFERLAPTTDLECGDFTMRKDAERVLRFLLAASAETAPHVSGDWQGLTVPHVYQHLTFYQEVIADSECFIVPITRVETGMLEHLLFMAWTEGSPGDERLICMDVLNPKGAIPGVLHDDVSEHLFNP